MTFAFTFTRRTFVRGAAAASAAGLLAACGGSSPSTPAATSTTGGAASTKAPTTAPAASIATPIPTSAAAPTAFSAASPTASPASQASAGQVKDVSFVVVDGTEPNSLDPCVGTGPFQAIINAMYDTLVRWTPQMNVEPALATAWSVSSDGKEWSFKLRPNVKFHDGTPFTSDAVKSTIDHIIDPKTLSTRRASYTLIKEVRTTDPQTAVIVTDPANPDLPFLLADGSANISSPAALQKYGADFGRNPVGTGPFKFAEWVPNDHITADMYPDYWGDKPLVKHFVYKPVPEAATRVVVLKNGEADVVMNLPPADIPGLQQESKLNIVSAPGLTIVSMEPKQTKPPFSIKEVRYALNQAVDKDAIIKNVMKGFARPLKTPDNPGLWGAFEFDPLPYDPKKAKDLLTQAGYANGMDITLFYVSGRWPGDDQVVQAVQGYWSQIGVRTTIKKVDSAGLDANLGADPDTNPGLIGMPIRTSLYTDYQLYRMYQTDATHANAAQRSGYSNPQVDQLIAQERSIFEPDKRLPIFQQIQKLIWDDQPMVYIMSQVNLYGSQKNVSGFIVLPSNGFYPRVLQKG